MKNHSKIFVLILIIVSTLIFLIPNKNLVNQNHSSSVNNDKPISYKSVPSTKTYKDNISGLSFYYPEYAEVVLEEGELSPEIKDVSITMDTLAGVNPIMTFKFAKDKIFLDSEEKITEPFGGLIANKYDTSIAGGEFVTYEFELKNGYLYVETSADFVSGKFNEIFQGENLKQLQLAHSAFVMIKNSTNF